MMRNFHKMIKSTFTNHLTKTDKNSETIYALATGTNTAVSIVRVGGPKAYLALELLEKKSIKNEWNNKCENKCENKDMIEKSTPEIISREQILEKFKIKPRKAHLRKLHNQNGNVIDESLVLYFPPEQSYNREEIIEFHVHGSKAIVSSIFSCLQQKQFRMAEPGEFTKRALLNGKINLAQAEAINDLIRSENEFERQIAVNNLMGQSEEFLSQLKDKIILCLANIEAYIDFQEDQSDVRSDLFDKNKNIVREAIDKLEQVENNYKNLQILKEGIHVAIVGKPNVGKSTLVNSLAKKDVAIVSDEAGTTRDVLHVTVPEDRQRLKVQGQFETCSILQVCARAETKSNKKAFAGPSIILSIFREKIKESQYKVLVVEGENPYLVSEDTGKWVEIEYLQIMEDDEVDFDQLIDDKTIVVVSKADTLPENFQNLPFFLKLPNSQKRKADLVINCQSSSETQKLLDLLGKRIEKEYQIYNNSEQIYFTRERYFVKLRNCKECLESFLEEERPDIACEYLRQALKEVSEVFGRVDVEEVLDVLFREFCIGK